MKKAALWGIPVLVILLVAGCYTCKRRMLTQLHELHYRYDFADKPCEWLALHLPLEFIEDPYIEYRHGLAWKAFVDRGAAAVPFLVSCVEQGKERVWKRALFKLKKMAYRIKEVVPTLALSLERVTTEKQIALLEVFMSLRKQAEIAVPAILTCFKASDENVVGLAIETLTAIRAFPETVIPKIVEVLSGNSSTAVKIKAAEMLGEWGVPNETALKVLMEIVRGNRAQTRYAAAEALVKIGDPIVVPFLKEIMNREYGNSEFGLMGLLAGLDRIRVQPAAQALVYLLNEKSLDAKPEIIEFRKLMKGHRFKRLYVYNKSMIYRILGGPWVFSRETGFLEKRFDVKEGEISPRYEFFVSINKDEDHLAVFYPPAGTFDFAIDKDPSERPRIRFEKSSPEIRNKAKVMKYIKSLNSWGDGIGK
jgi:hypothetical protein